MARRYRREALVVEAVKYEGTWESARAIAEMAGSGLGVEGSPFRATTSAGPWGLPDRALLLAEGKWWMEVEVGDWVFLGERGLRVMDGGVFERSFKEVEMSEVKEVEGVESQFHRLAGYILEKDLMPVGFEGGAADCAIAVMEKGAEHLAASEGERARLLELVRKGSEVMVELVLEVEAWGGRPGWDRRGLDKKLKSWLEEAGKYVPGLEDEAASVEEVSDAG